VSLANTNSESSEFTNDEASYGQIKTNINSDEPGRLSWESNELPNEWRFTIEGVDMGTVGELSFNQVRNTMTITAMPLNSTITYNVVLQEGINLISVPLDPGETEGQRWRLSELINFIGSGATMVISYNKAEKTCLVRLTTNSESFCQTDKKRSSPTCPIFPTLPR